MTGWSNTFKSTCLIALFVFFSAPQQDLLTQHIKVHFTDPNIIRSIGDAGGEPNLPKPASTGLAQSHPEYKLDTSAEKEKDSSELIKENGDSSNAITEGKENSLNNNDTSYVCQYCARSFNASDKLLRHEMQHLIGQNA